MFQGGLTTDGLGPDPARVPHVPRVLETTIPGAAAVVAVGAVATVVTPAEVAATRTEI